MEVLGVGKRYRSGEWVVRDVSLQLQPRDLVVFEGANGSGKSSLLRMMAGISRVTVGDISGRPATISYAPDNLPADERMSARTLLSHVGRLRGMSRREVQRAADALIDRFALVGDPRAAMRTLSKGNVQKVCLAQAFLVPTDLVVLDEPASSLDEAAEATLSALIAERRNEGAICVLSGHPERGSRHEDATVYDVADGQVVRRVLRAFRVATFSPTANAVEVAWLSQPGVEAVTPKQAGAVEVRVSFGHSDRLIETALKAAWTVEDVSSP